MVRLFKALLLLPLFLSHSSAAVDILSGDFPPSPRVYDGWVCPAEYLSQFGWFSWQTSIPCNPQTQTCGYVDFYASVADDVADLNGAQEVFLTRATRMPDTQAGGLNLYLALVGAGQYPKARFIRIRYVRQAPGGMPAFLPTVNRYAISVGCMPNE